MGVFVDMNWGMNPQPPTIPTLSLNLLQDWKKSIKKILHEWIKRLPK